MPRGATGGGMAPVPSIRIHSSTPEGPTACHVSRLPHGAGVGDHEPLEAQPPPQLRLHTRINRPTPSPVHLTPHGIYTGYICWNRYPGVSPCIWVWMGIPPALYWWVSPQLQQERVKPRSNRSVLAPPCGCEATTRRRLVPQSTCAHAHPRTLARARYEPPTAADCHRAADCRPLYTALRIEPQSAARASPAN